MRAYSSEKECQIDTTSKDERPLTPHNSSISYRTKRAAVGGGAPHRGCVRIVITMRTTLASVACSRPVGSSSHGAHGVNVSSSRLLDAFEQTTQTFFRTVSMITRLFGLSTLSCGVSIALARLALASAGEFEAISDFR